MSAGALGRTLLLKKNSVIIASLKSKSFTVNSEPVDVTTDDDGGYRCNLPESGLTNIDISFDGVETDGILRGLMLSGGLNQQYTDFTLTWDNGDLLACDFNFTSYEESASTSEGITFSGSLQSSGEWTYTVAP